MMTKHVVWLSLALGVAAACGSSDEDTNESAPSHDAGADATVENDAAIDTSGPPPKRRIVQKNPFGNVAASDNALWDGDFEWSTQFASQYAWVPVTGLGVGLAPFQGIRASAECKSGMKCAFMTQNLSMAGIGVSPGGKKVAASIWARPPDGVCKNMTIALIGCSFVGDSDLQMTDADDAPDADGWCHYEAVSDVRTQASCIYVVADFVDGEAIVDDAVIRAAPDDAAPTTLTPEANQRARIEQARRTIREYLKPRPVTPTRAKEELDRWLARKR
jgi:hypothetical protein